MDHADLVDVRERNLGSAASMTRIGKVKAFWINDPATPCFRVVTEGGRAVLGCWRSVGYESIDWMDGSAGPPRTIFERVS